MKNTYRGYYLNYYNKNDNKVFNNRYQTFKPRPYDDAEYYWAYSYNKVNWTIVYNKKVIGCFKGTFEQVIDIIETNNSCIKPKMIHC